MGALVVIIKILLILLALVIIVSVLMQEGQRQGLGAIAGGAETFLGKNKAKGMEEKLHTITKIAALVFIILALVCTILVSAGNKKEEAATEDISVSDIAELEEDAETVEDEAVEAVEEATEAAEEAVEEATEAAEETAEAVAEEATEAVEEAAEAVEETVEAAEETAEDTAA